MEAPCVRQRDGTSSGALFERVPEYLYEILKLFLNVLIHVNWRITRMSYTSGFED